MHPRSVLYGMRRPLDQGCGGTGVNGIRAIFSGTGIGPVDDPSHNLARQQQNGCRAGEEDMEKSSTIAIFHQSDKREMAIIKGHERRLSIEK